MLIRLFRMTFYDGATFFTTVSNSCCFRGLYLLKVIPPFATVLKAFRTPALFQFVKRNCQVTMPTAHPVPVFGQQYELTVSAGIHAEKPGPYPPPPTTLSERHSGSGCFMMRLG